MADPFYVNPGTLEPSIQSKLSKQGMGLESCRIMGHEEKREGGSEEEGTVCVFITVSTTKVRLCVVVSRGFIHVVVSQQFKTPSAVAVARFKFSFSADIEKSYLALTLSRDGWRSRAKYHPRALQEVAALFLSPFRVQMKQARGRCLVVVSGRRAYSATWHPRLSSADHIGPVHVNAMTPLTADMQIRSSCLAHALNPLFANYRSLTNARLDHSHNNPTGG
jgi:hypothetical protein